MKQRLLLYILAIFTSVAISAQPYCDVRTFTIRDGLPASIISGFTQANSGLMWFSTWNGLCYYDGYRFTTFRSEPGEDEVLTTNRIMMVKQSRTGDMWLYTSDRRAYIFDTKSCRFIDINRIIGEKTGHGVSVRGIYPLANGFTWLVTNQGGASYRLDDSRIKDGDGIEVFSVENGNLKHNIINKVQLDSQGREWVFTTKGVNLLRGAFNSDVVFEYRIEMGQDNYLATKAGKLFMLPAGESRPQVVALPDDVGDIRQLLSLDSTNFLVATDIGVVEYDVNHRRSKVYSVQNPSQPSSLVIALYVDSKKRIWAYADGPGVSMIDTATGRVKWYTAQAASAIERTACEKEFFHEDEIGTVWLVPKDGTFSYYCESEDCLNPYVLKSQNSPGTDFPILEKYGVDSEKNLWFTSTRDISLVNFKYHYFKHTSVGTNQEVRALLTDNEGRTWVGTTDGLLMVYDRNNSLIGYVSKSGGIQKSPTRFSDRIYALAEDSKRRIWVGTKGRGIHLLDSSARELAHFMSDAKDKYSLTSDVVYSFHEDNHDRMWIGTYGGALQLVEEAEGRFRFINSNNLLTGFPIDRCQNIRRITRTADSTVILSTSGGVVTFSDNFRSPSDIRFFVSPHVPGNPQSVMANDVMQTVVTTSGEVLTITLGGGIQRLSSKELLRDSLEFASLPNVNLGEGIIQSAVEDNGGNVWLLREKGIDCYNLATNSITQYGPGNIGMDVELTEAKPAHDKETDAIVVAARGAFLRFNPVNLTKSTYCPRIEFTSVLYHGDDRHTPILDRKVLEIDLEHRNFTVHFSALEYADKYMVEYAYKLEGVDEKWNYLEGNSASFNRIPPGNHRLLVRSTNCDGVWMDNTAALNINVAPTFWETAWAKLLYVLLFCMAIYVAVYIYALRSKARVEREISDVKTRFFTEISHKLRTPLTLIGGPVTEVLNAEHLTDAARKHLEMVQRNSRNMLELVNKMLRYNLDKSVYISDDNIGGEEVETAFTDRETHDREETSEHTRLLIVEDNDDLRSFLHDILSADYEVLQAENGKVGLDIAQKEMPDFIITDVMMPEMDGLTMVRHIKRNAEICHIPIVVLSAKASLDDRVQGLSEGVDDYITKPFSALYLKSRVRNIITQRRMLQQTYVEQIHTDDITTYQLSSPQVADADNEMMKTLLSFLDENLGDSDLKIDDLADKVNMSRSLFNAKLKSIVGMTPVDFLRHMRIQRAEDLIVRSDYTFSQISYMVGFSDPKYFSKCFKKETGMTPSECRAHGNTQD